MPSKKKLKKRYRKLEDRYENLYSKFQDAGREAWGVSRAHGKAVKELRELQTAARELVHALDDGRQDDIPTRKDAVRDLLPGEPWTLDRIMRLQSTIRAMSEAISKPIDREIIERDWTDSLPDESPALAEAVKKARADGPQWGSWTVTAGGQFVPIVDPYNAGRPVVHEVKADENNSILRNDSLLDEDPRFRRANPSSEDAA